MKSGFATIAGRPNVGKSTLLNKILGTKVSITSDKPNTTRSQIRGVLNHPGVQVVFVDTPGLHRPKTPLGERLNAAASSALSDVDVVIVVVDATAPIGGGDRMVAERAPAESILVVNKVDLANRREVVQRLDQAASLGLSEYRPVSSTTGEGIPELVQSVMARLPEGPQYYPDGVVSDVPDAFWVAELVREQLLAATRHELPHSIACRVTEWEWPRIRCEVLVERESQKGIVIGKQGSVLKAVGTAVRSELPPGAFIELFVKVDKDWQRKPAALQRLGY